MNSSRLCCSSSPGRSFLALVLLPALLVFAGPRLAAQGYWSAVGPEGGDARSFAAVPGQPSHLYLGTTDSWLYESTNRGESWHRLAKIGDADDLILDDIVADGANPGTIFVAAWKLDRPGGGLWVSRDWGKSWSAVEGLRGQSIRAFAQAPSDAKTFFAGTLDGVYRSADGGATWMLVSPPGSQEIHEVESLAVDPSDPNTVYAGTWHLPWKTADGGKSWQNIKDGVIEDSDVFSIIVDPAKPSTVYLSACSGIYKSENGGEHFKKIQGIPASARRTRVLMQDPANPEVVYAGTTEGLYKTENGGKSFEPLTGTDVIVNDIFVDPKSPEHVLLATDRAGVLESRDAGASFSPSNKGFSQRKVEALLVDRTNPMRLYAGVANDKAYGGVFVSNNGGSSWEQVGAGLNERDVFALAQAPDGTVLAGTNHGIFALQPSAADAPAGTPALVWVPRNSIANTVVKAATETVLGKRIDVEKTVKAAVVQLESRVNALDLSGDAWLASTSFGLLTSRDGGESWQGGPAIGSTGFVSVAAHGALLAAARTDGVALSTDAGLTWRPMGVPTVLTRVNRVAFSKDGTVWLGAREGVYFSHDLGKTWLWVHRLPLGDVDDLYYDAAQDKVLVASRSRDQVFVIDPKRLDWTWRQTGYRISQVRTANGRLVAASLFDGVLLEPQPAATQAKADEK